MNASHANRTTHRTTRRVWLMACALVFGAALVTSTVASAAPVDLSPPKNQEQVPLRPVPKAAPRKAPTPPPVSDTPAPVMGGAVQAETLGQINPDVAGTLAQADGGFGSAMWWGTDRRLIDNLIATLPVTTSSPAMRDLMRRLLLTGAVVPEGGEPGSLISLRAGLLAAMGDFQGVNALLAVVPGYSANPDLLRVEMDTRLLTGDVARACQMAHAHINTQNTLYWQKAFTFCQAMEGKSQQALLGLALIDELGGADPVFSKLVDAIARQSNAPELESLSDPTPLHIAMARVAKAALPSDVISSNRPSVLRAIAISPNASPELRLEASERAEAAGALPVDALRQLYASIEFNDEELKNPLTVASQRSGPMSRALLYRATLNQTVPAAQAEALSSALDMARSGGRYASAARAFLPQLTRIEPTRDLAWFAPEAIRAFLITGRQQGAQPWFDILAVEATRTPKMANQLKRLMPVAKLSNFEPAADWTMQQLPEWWGAMRGDDGAREKAGQLVAAFDALGEFVPDEMWVNLSQGPSHTQALIPHPSLWFLVDAASTQARVGETVLLSMVILGEGGPARADPMVLHRVLKALRYVGLRDEVRLMALEAVVAAGL